MLFTVQITYITHLHLSLGKTAIPSTSKVALSSVGLYAFALLLSAIPFLPSVAGFSYTAEGFCFIDYYDDAINTVFFLMMLVTMGCVWYYTMLSYTALSNKQGHGQTSALGNGISNSTAIGLDGQGLLEDASKSNVCCWCETKTRTVQLVNSSPLGCIAFLTFPTMY
jgi:hypothetical protein